MNFSYPLLQKVSGWSLIVSSIFLLGMLIFGSFFSLANGARVGSLLTILLMFGLSVVAAIFFGGYKLVSDKSYEKSTPKTLLIFLGLFVLFNIIVSVISSIMYMLQIGIYE